MKAFAFVAGIAALLAVAVPAGASNTVTVHVFSFDFSVNPAGGAIADPTIDLGDTVHWVWDDGTHTTTSVNGLSESWDSGLHFAPFSFDHTFTHTGTFWYYCRPHGSDLGNGTASGMAGTITVVPEPASGAAMLALAGLFGLRRWRR